MAIGGSAYLRRSTSYLDNTPMPTKSEKTRLEARREYARAYSKRRYGTPEYKESRKRYEASPKGKAARKRSRAKPAFREKRRAYARTYYHTNAQLKKDIQLLEKRLIRIEELLASLGYST